MIADLEKFDGKDIEIKEIYIPLIKSEYKENEINFLKNECDFLPRILNIDINNYEGTISISCDKANKIEWYDDKQNLIDTKFNFSEKFITKFSVKNLTSRYIIFKITGEYGEKISNCTALMCLKMMMAHLEHIRVADIFLIGLRKEMD